MDPETEAKWGFAHHDPKCVRKFTVTTAVLWAEEQERSKEAIKNCTVPVLMIEANNDGVVRNDYIDDFYAMAGKNVETERQAKSKVPNHMVKIPEVDHTTICFEESSVQTLITEMVTFFDKIIKEKSAK